MSRPTASSNNFTSYWKNATLSSQQDTSTLRRIQQMALQEESTHPEISFSHGSNSQSNLSLSLLTSTPPSNLANDLLLTAFLQNQKSTSTNQNGSGDNKRTTTQTSSQTLPHKHYRLTEMLSNTPPPHESMPKAHPFKCILKRSSTSRKPCPSTRQVPTTPLNPLSPMTQEVRNPGPPSSMATHTGDRPPFTDPVLVEYVVVPCPMYQRFPRRGQVEFFQNVPNNVTSTFWLSTVWEYCGNI